MRNAGIIIFLLTLFFLSPGCNNNARKTVFHPSKDSAKIEKEADDDSVDYANCYEGFFNGLPRFKDSTSAYLVWKNGKRKSLTRFFTDEFMSPVSEYGLKDLDGDGKKELVVFNYTGGAHCCNEYYFFAQRNEKEFEYRAHIQGGQACIDSSTNIITYSFSESFGYFYSCYACRFDDSSSVLKNISDIRLRYGQSKLEIISYDSMAEKQNLQNLDFLKEHGYEKVSGMMDNGWRKEFAINFALWHYNHGKNWKATKALFDNYYSFQDRLKMWKEFYKEVVDIGKENSF